MAEQHSSPVEAEEQIDLDGDNDIEEEDMMDEEEDPTEEEDDRSSRYRKIRDEEDSDQDRDQEEQGQEHGGSEVVPASASDDAPSSLKDEEEEEEKPVVGSEEAAAAAAADDDSSEKEKHAELLSLPPHGSEVFIGGLPRDATEEDLRDLCEPFGEIFEVKLARDKDKRESKGFAFITFTTKDAAENAIEGIQDKEFKGKTLRCSLSQVKHRLFIGNVPKNLTEDELRKILQENGPGVESIECFKDLQNPSRNRGFLFVEYYNHACADYAKQKMSNSSFKMEGSMPSISWADPKISSDSSAASQVKALYVKNLPENVTSEKLKDLFERHGEVTKVVLPPSKTGQNKRDYGFIHFAERSSALKAVKGTDKYEIDGQVIEVYLAKPQTDKKSDYASNSYKSGHVPNYPQYPSYGYSGEPYGAYGATGVGQPVIYGRGPTPAGMRMVPMVLPDGRLGYVLQQPGAQASPPPPPRRSDRSSGSSEGGGRGDKNRGRRYRPY